MEAKLRAATAADVDRLVNLERACGVDERTAEAYSHELSLAWSAVLVLELPQVGVVASAVRWTIEDEVELHWIAVHPEHRRRGLASQLIDEVLTHARHRGAYRVLLEVRRSNTGAQALYRAHGFQPIGVRRGYYQRDGEDAVVMELRLPADASVGP